MNKFFLIADKTPLWVFPLFVYLLYIGITSLKTRVVSLLKIFLIGAFFLIFSIKKISRFVEIHEYVSYLWLASLTISAFIGYLICSLQNVKIDKGKKLVSISGSPVTLILIIFIFSSNYFFGALFSMHPELKFNLSYLLPMSAVVAFPSGVFLGRTIHLILKYFKGPYTNLGCEN